MLGLGVTTTPGLPLVPIVYAAALVATLSEVVETLKSDIVWAAGLVTLTRVSTIESPALIVKLVGSVADPLAKAAPVTTIVRDWVVSLSETPVTVAKLVGPVVSLKKTSPPAVSALDVRKLTVYVVVAPASGEAGVTVAAVTELPKVMAFVVSTVPVAGCTVRYAVAAEVGFCPVAKILSVPPFETGIANVSETHRGACRGNASDSVIRRRAA